MKGLKEKELYAVLVFMNLLFLLKILESCYKIQNFKYAVVAGILITAIGIYFLYSTVLRKRVYKVSVTLVSITVLAILCYYKRKYIGELIPQYVEGLKVLNDAIYNYQPTEFNQFLLLFALLIPLVSNLLLLISNKGGSNILILINTGVLLLFWYGTYTEDIKKYLNIYIFISLVSYSIDRHIKKIKKMKKNGVRVELQMVKTIASVLFIAFFTAGFISILPQEYKGKYNSDMVGTFVNKYNQIKENEQGPGKKKYDLASSGYSDNDKKLGGPIVLNENLVFKIKSDKPYYLRGNIKDLYDGTSWKQAESNYVNQNLVERYLDRFLQNLGLEQRNMEIYPIGTVNTSTLFSPNFSTKVAVYKGDIFIEDFGYTFQNSIVSSDPYTVSFYGGEEDLSLLKNLTAKRAIQNAVVYSGRQTRIPEQYLQLPSREEMQQAYDLAQTITAGSKTNYEKARKIEEYLSANYTYSLDVSVVPKGEDFLSYFLFKEKKGYCTYFATATVLLCRMVDVPARYVEGFKMSNKKGDKDLYEVTNGDAHAWAEVLALPNERVWGIVDPSPTPTEEKIKEEEEKILKEAEQEADNIDPVTGMKRNKAEKEEEDTGNAAVVVMKLSKPTIITLSAIGFIFLWISIRVLFIWNKRKRIFNKNSILPLYKYTMHRLRRVGIVKEDHEAELEFVEKIREKKLQGKMQDLIPLVYEEFYGKIKNKDFDSKEFYEFIEKYIKEKQGKIKYFSRRFIFWQ